MASYKFSTYLLFNTYYFVCENQTWQWRNVAEDHPSKTITRFFVLGTIYCHKWNETILYLPPFISSWELGCCLLLYLFSRSRCGDFFSHKHFIYSRLSRDFLNSFLMPVLHAIKPLSHILGDFKKSSFKSTHSTF